MNTIFDQYVIMFFIFSVLGYIGEVLYCSIPAHRFVNRGFMYGPWLPIYGFGGVSIRLIASLIGGHASTNPFVVFAFSFVFSTIIEYIGSWILQTAFGIKLWDYSKHKCNIKGRVCLLNSTIFGFAGLFISYCVHPLLKQSFSFIPEAWMPRLSSLIIVVMVSDATASILRMASFKLSLKDISTQKKALEAKLASLKSGDVKDYVKQKFDLDSAELKARLRVRYARLFSAFPSMTSANSELRLQLEAFKAEVQMHLPRKNK